ncbi:hypothetical protein [Microbaculum marinum]|uniref:Uncharacterized protein n=1 Tax=Microbaculum marinum TaxID=1764581 RepID=A0AAW9RHU3_9HYPH
MAGAGQAVAEPQPGEPGYGVTFNQQIIDRLQGAPAFNIDDPLETFRHVFAAVPGEATVYPTENYYYFSFVWSGIEFAGNIRLDVADRDDGVLHFAYFSKNEPWNVEILTNYKPLTESDGVTVEKAGDLAYDVTFEGKTVHFRLNDMSGIEPPEGLVADGDTYLGPAFDESGLSFFVLFNEDRKDFMFVLNETGYLNDFLLPYHDDHPALTVGARTGFAFYEDRFAPRKVLVGVYGGSVSANTYFDGPFDQLPDNFIPGEELRDAILAKYPELDGQIDRLGHFRAQEGRFLVNPYINYDYPGQLEQFLRCGDSALDEAKFYACLAPGDGQ